MEQQPTIFHITHWKAGSQWVAAVLRECAPGRFVKPVVQSGHFLDEPVKPGALYPSIYLPRPFFDTVLCGKQELDMDALIDGPWSQYALDRYLAHPGTAAVNREHFAVQRKPYKKVVIIRDLRDTLISFYFSTKVSHELMDDKQARVRNVLHKRTKEQGLLMMNNWVPRQVKPIQLSWTDDDEALHLKYEDLIADEYACFERLVEFCEIEISRSRLHDVIRKHAFETVTGRKRGTEDVKAHHRKGIAGDWKNHFTDHVKEAFKKEYGEVLIRTGYEDDFDW